MPEKVFKKGIGAVLGGEGNNNGPLIFQGLLRHFWLECKAFEPYFLRFEKKKKVLSIVSTTGI